MCPLSPSAAGCSHGHSVSTDSSNSTSVSSSPPPTSTSPSASAATTLTQGTSLGLNIGATVGATCGVLALVAGCLFCYRRYRRRNGARPVAEEGAVAEPFSLKVEVTSSSLVGTTSSTNPMPPFAAVSVLICDSIRELNIVLARARNRPIHRDSATIDPACTYYRAPLGWCSVRY